MSKRKAVKTPARRKRTLTLTPETSTKLSVEAERRGIDRSAAAEILLADALRHIVVQFRAREPGQDESAA